MESDEARPYVVRAESGRHEVVNSSKRVIVVCQNEAGAENYATLLNEAYATGFKAGYRAGKRGPTKDR